MQAFLSAGAPLFSPCDQLRLYGIHVIPFDDLAEPVGNDLSAARVFDGEHFAADLRLHGAVFESKVASLRRAIDQPQIFAVTKRLRADDAAADKSQVFGIPAEVFALDDAVRHGHVFGMPEGVFRIELAMRGA